MELMQLEYFIETARREHISKTAEALNITQPALSKSISRLEEDLGVKLFAREGKNIRLNAYGAVVMRYAEQILYSIGDMRAELEQLQSGMAGMLRIGSSFPAQEPNWLLQVIRDFAFQYPDVQFSLKQYPSDQLPDALRQREIDLAVSSEPIQAAEFQWEELFTEPMGIILSADHSLARKQALSMSDLVRERFYCNNANSDTLKLTKRFCELAGFEPTIHFEGDFPTFIGQAVALGYGVSVISERGFLRNAKNQQRQPWEEQIVYRPLKESYCQRTCGIAYLPLKVSSPLLGAFRAALLAQFPTTKP